MSREAAENTVVNQGGRRGLMECYNNLAPHTSIEGALRSPEESQPKSVCQNRWQSFGVSETQLGKMPNRI